MPKTVTLYTKNEIEGMIKKQSEKDKEEIYAQLNKLKNKQFDFDKILTLKLKKDERR